MLVTRQGSRNCFMVGRNVNCYNVIAVESSMKKLKIELLYDTVIPFLGTYLKECVQDMTEPLAQPCLLQPYSQ
jgi:hypothetical protein